MSREEQLAVAIEHETRKSALCKCSHERRYHHKEKSCTAIIDEVRLRYCKCEEFREVKSEEEIEMAKEKKARKPKGERKERVRRTYAFDVEKARKLRDEKYKDKDNATATLLRGLIASNKDGYTLPEMAKIVEFKGDANKFPVPPAFFDANVLKRTSETKREKKPKSARSAAKGAPNPKRIRKPRGAKLPVAAAEQIEQATA